MSELEPAAVTLTAYWGLNNLEEECWLADVTVMLPPVGDLGPDEGDELKARLEEALPGVRVAVRPHLVAPGRLAATYRRLGNLNRRGRSVVELRPHGHG